MRWPEPPVGADLPLRRATRRVACLLVVAFLALASVYSVVTPLFEAPDEAFHYAVVEYLAGGHGLPVLDPAEPGPWLQEAGQPPLYYLMAALISRWAPGRDLPGLLRRYPHASIGYVRPDGHANYAIHTQREAFPYRGTVLAMHLARWLSVACGALTVLFTYALGLEALPREPIVALTAAGIVGLTPMFLFLSGAVSNDVLVAALATLSLWQSVRLLRLPPTPGRCALLGVTLGLAALSKVSALGLIPVAGLVLAWAAWQRRDWRVFTRSGACMVGLAILVAGWWYYRNWRLYHDPLGLNAFLGLAGHRSATPSWQQLLAECQGFLMSYWGVFGWVNVIAPAWFYRLLDGLAALGAGGLAFQVRRCLHQRRWPHPDDAFRLSLLAAWVVIIFGSLIRYTLLIPASVGRLAFPAIAPISFFLANGIVGCVPRRLQGLPALAALMLMASLAIWVPFRVIAPAYARPPLLTPAELRAIPERLDLSLGGQVELLGYALATREVEPGQNLAVTLYWRAQAPMAEDYTVFVHLLDEYGRLVAQRDSYPGRGMFPTTLWQPGDALADTYILRMPSSLARPTRLRIEAGMYRLRDYVRLPVCDSKGHDLAGAASLGEVWVRPASCKQIANPLRANLANKIALVGYSLDRAAFRPGETIRLTLFWQALVPMDEDYTVFTHILGPGNAMLAQKDAPPLEGTAPTSSWPVGEVVCDTYDLVLQPDAPSGSHELEVGLYLHETMERLPVLGADGQPQGDRILLTRIDVRAK